MEEIARHSSADDLYKQGMYFLDVLGHKDRAIEYLDAAADKGHSEALNELNKLKSAGAD
jgi:hypothetical protein